MTDSSHTPRNRRSSSPFKKAVEPVIETFEKDDRVTHDLYGLGRVVNVEAHAVSVDFGERTLRITSPYAKLHHL
ncbi:hypothetical protein [Nocardioides okcheonensis]|uniref:hypothetical protein n=1 Tax=Nocardioides okcheonensis TaxID=2894081 RepID=UPI001E534EA3|nr:hypothetical protein [Nocardioides okcheonensis]UFN46411.1 hypothetical protein LN652_09475 [Nocardioides okcheonensis]